MRLRIGKATCSRCPAIYAVEDAKAVHEILGQGYHVVVGNPPYIIVRDRSSERCLPRAVLDLPSEILAWSSVHPAVLGPRDPAGAKRTVAVATSG